MTDVIPITNLGRPAEHGRLRFGVRDSKRGTKAIDTWRFTSPDQAAIEVLASLYGGEARPWHDDKANPPDQWEVISESAEVEVYLPPEGGLSQSYEIWGGGGLVRRCDGMTMSVPIDDGYSTGPCQCFAEGAMHCRPKTRLNVFLPQVPFAGTWRLESSSKNVLHEFKGMYDAVSRVQAMAPSGERGSLVRCFLTLVHQTQRSKGKTRKFIIPKFRLAVSIDDIAGGLAGVELEAPPVAALPAPQEPAGADVAPGVVDAEIEPQAAGEPRTWKTGEPVPPDVKVKKIRGGFVEVLE